MASAMQFEQPAMNWGASETYQEFQRFKQLVEFTFNGYSAKADKKDRVVGYLESESESE